MKNKIIPVFFGAALLLGGVLTVSLNQKETSPAKAYEDMSLASGGDSFLLTEKEYSATESFVYTGELYFNEGQAGGLVFGGVEGSHYYVINLDRYENHIKLIEFTFDGGDLHAEVLNSDDFIGNNKNVKPQEWTFINSQVRNISNVNMKVVVTVEDEHAYAEFFVEGIKRFGIDTTIDLNENGTYVGGKLGLNCFNANVVLRDIEAGKSDYSYFSEPYRNQYHLQPFAKWSNDPNALCYYNGWYHVFYQTYPFGLQWGSMYWGHARSRDLIHFEYLPICLFPEHNDDGSEAYMWSGCAVAYYKGMSADVDARNWFPNGNGNGLFAIFTSDLCGGPEPAQNQIIITSDDEGLTWEKRDVIYQRQKTPYYNEKIDWRDPKIFPVEKDGSGKVTTWGMTLSSYALNKGWLLRSTNLIDWYYDSFFALPTPECIGIGVLEDEDGVEHAYLTNKSRTYLFGSVGLNGAGSLRFLDEDGVNISTYSLDEMKQKLKLLDFGPDSYASQSFYITDSTSDYYGKDIVLNWFSGDLNASFCTGPGEYAGLRGRWNGGFTIPVEYGIYTDNSGEMRLSQKPITVNNEHLEKTELVSFTDYKVDYQTGNLLKDVHSHTFELEASITIKEDSPIIFKVDVGENEYMQFGWNTTDGYYVDRTYLDDKGINTNIDWHAKYASHILGDSDTKTFYVLNDNGGLEVFCEDYSIPFYFVTTAAVSSNGAYFHCDGPIDDEATATDERAVINYLKVSEIISAYQKEIAPGEGVLHVTNTKVQLDTTLSTTAFVSCWYTGNADLEWEEVSNSGAVEATTSNYGLSLKAVRTGSALYKVSAEEKEETISVTVSSGIFDSDFTFKKEDVIAGTWSIANGALVGEKASGNGFLLAKEVGSDFTYTGQFDINSGTAGALVFRAASDMSSYLVANYDTNEHVVKIWSTRGELVRSGHVDVGVNNVVITIKTSGKNVKVSLNGNEVIDYNLADEEPLNGRFGVNVFSSKVSFKTLSLVEDEQNVEYTSGELKVNLGIKQYVSAVYNLTAANSKLEPGFYSQSNDELSIKEEYFSLLENGLYRLKVVGSLSIIHINVTVNMASHQLVVGDVTTELGLNVNVFVGSFKVTSLAINGKDVKTSKYFVKDYVLTIDSSCFNEGENTVVINNTTSFKVTVNNNIEQGSNGGKSCGGNIVTTSVILSLISLSSILLVIISNKRKKREDL